LEYFQICRGESIFVGVWGKISHTKIYKFDSATIVCCSIRETLNTH
jgi:hypothetical protein